MSKRRTLGKLGWLATGLCLLTLLHAADVSARAGGGRSFGSRGSRTGSFPSRSYSPSQPMRPQPSQPYNPPYSSPSQPSSGGGFLRNMAGGLIGGMVGSMLFRSLGFGSGWGNGMGGGGFGLLELLLVGGLFYFMFKMLAGRKREFSASGPVAVSQPDYGFETRPSYVDSQRFKETAQDLFFKVQGAWTRADLGRIQNIVTPEMLQILQGDLDALKARGEVNRLENIAVREVEVTEAWSEGGMEYATVRFLANLLDYHANEAGKVISGSDIEPVKFEEFWTLQRPQAGGSWVLSAIQQGNA